MAPIALTGGLKDKISPDRNFLSQDRKSKSSRTYHHKIEGKSCLFITKNTFDPVKNETFDLVKIFVKPLILPKKETFYLVKFDFVTRSHSYNMIY
jgi:hypothetical protein